MSINKTVQLDRRNLQTNYDQTDHLYALFKYIAVRNLPVITSSSCQFIRYGGSFPVYLPRLRIDVFVALDYCHSLKTSEV